METRANPLHDLFSRSSTPPIQQQQQQLQQQQQQQQQQPQSFAQPTNTSPNHLESLFHGLSAPHDQQQEQQPEKPQVQQQPQQQPQQPPPQPQAHMQSQSQPPVQQQQQMTESYASPPITSSTQLPEDPAIPAPPPPPPPPPAQTTHTERQNALLSLLGGPPASSVSRAPVANLPVSQQIPSPPVSHKSNASPSHNEAQGKILLEQLMARSVYLPDPASNHLSASSFLIVTVTLYCVSTNMYSHIFTSASVSFLTMFLALAMRIHRGILTLNPPRSNYSDSQRGSLPGVPSPPYGSSPHREGEYRSYDQSDPNTDMQQRTSNQPISSATVQQPQQQQPPSPRKSMFDYFNPFDHLSNTSTTLKKRPPQAQPPSTSNATEDTGAWTAVSDPKRQSVESLLENLTRGQTSQMQSAQPVQPVQQVQPVPSAYDSYLSSSDFSQGEQAVPGGNRTVVPPPPLPPKPLPTRAASPPRTSPPKNQTQNQRSIGRSEGLTASSHPAPSVAGSVTGSIAGGRRDKESSPGPRGGYRGKGNARVNNNKNQSSPSPQMQSIVFDVSQPLDEIQASRDYVKSTAIALVRQEPVFLPGTTIGATHWVAYAMTRGRVRVISRSSGDRTLLQLPHLFPTNTSVTDMAVYGNRLAGITSDGGFVLWEIPELFTDDVPGHLVLCVPPAGEYEPLHSIKWHPKDPDRLAVASDRRIYLLDLSTNQNLHNRPIQHNELHLLGQMFSIPSPVVAFDFDVLNYALATISVDSTLTTWNIHDKLPYTTHKIRGEDVPSSLTFVDGGIVVGRKNGTVFQLLSATTKNVLSTVKFVNGSQEDPDMFGHVSYDSRIQTLWVANCRRESMVAIKLNIDPAAVGNDEGYRNYFDQVVEFPGPKPTIHFVILTADADPHGDEAHAACIAAKVPPGELALVAFSVHSVGVDQVLIRKEWFDSALASTVAKFPIASPDALVQAAAAETKGSRLSTHVAQPVAMNPPPRARTPPSEEVENEYGRDEGRAGDHKGRGQKGKNVNWNQKEESGRDKDKAARVSDATILNESMLGQALTREIKKTEESLHNRIGRLINKEMDKQHQRFEDARAHEQAEDFARQEKILKLISTELTRNTTRVVEMAVKNEVHSSVLPALENITKTEVKAALNDQIGRGLMDMINQVRVEWDEVPSLLWENNFSSWNASLQTLPIELEKLLLRPDFASHFAHNLSTTLTPVIERHVKESIAKTFIPIYSQQSSAIHQELLREMRSELHNVKTELTAWHSEFSRSQETSVRELEHTVRSLSDQVKFLSMNSSTTSGLHLQQSQPTHTSPGPAVTQMQSNLTQQHLRQPNLGPAAVQPSSSYGHPHGKFPQQTTTTTQQAAPPPPMHASWYPSSIAAPQASHPATIPQPPPQTITQERTSPIKHDQWDEIYLSVLQTQDAVKLRDLLSHTNPEVIMPLNGPSLVSQAVVLTLIHRLSAMLGETPPNDEQFKTSLWWLQRSVALLRPEDKLIADFIPRVVPNVQQLLNTTKQRITILPGGANTVETARNISDVQETLRRKAAVSV
ncbi:hypothetical protein AMATHDRAFT_41111 [Amanita thiersii Skay4041]|uniref:Enhancer of mRNA-decapping protein 4 WD40 repeat region domain-containing protein n=1 Tax=Amanita thiersii Skay4041 TaxID=703135 RepID=A0A2A9NNZ6_9AGAR|nr:hypothetical protein AMATHDRAFT_41111 [Amanita thiersii Skay4041]